MIERMGHDDAQVRASTYDELVIGTGVRLPFDGDGPFRVQVQHQARWRAWWVHLTRRCWRRCVPHGKPSTTAGTSGC